ncbi:MAG TPA: SMC family ATPase [Thermoplasmata archaeon]
MKLTYLELRNYRRFKEVRLELPDGIVGILGPNGSGKSTIIEGIAWALFGNVEEVVRTSKEGVKRAGSKPNEPCGAVVEFELGGIEYRVEREMGGKSLSVKAHIRSKDKILAEGDSSVRAMVQKLIGMDYKSFYISVFARQKELNALQNVQTAERKKTVLRMLRIDGIDSVLTEIRSDKKDSLSRIEGATQMLLAEDGREKELVLAERLPLLSTAYEQAGNELGVAERTERSASADVERSRKLRDELKRDADAFIQAESDFRAKSSAVDQMRMREKSTLERLEAMGKKIERLPELKQQELEYRDITDKKELMDKEREKSQRAMAIAGEIGKEETEREARESELKDISAKLASPTDLESMIKGVEAESQKCEADKTSISSRMAELRTTSSERAEAAKKDRAKLEEIRHAGKDGKCPTCERRLDEAYELLITKLTQTAGEAEKASVAANLEIEKLQKDLGSLARKAEALRKKRDNMEKDRRRLAQAETATAERMMELRKLADRLGLRRKELAALGKIDYSLDEHLRVQERHKKLKELHDEFVKLTKEKEHADGLAKDLESLREHIERAEKEMAQFRSMSEKLEPNKVRYEYAQKELDQKNDILNKAKDALMQAVSKKQRAEGEVERTKKELEDVARLKKSIEKDRTVAEDLALLEDVVVSFKDHLIARIRPALSELTSRSFEAMTDGRYTRAELDEDYEIQIDDQGTMYPLSRFSGGEGDLANLSLRLAISSIIADRTAATPINFLILDEIFGSLDPERKRSVMVALSRLSAQFSQIFLITHIEDIRDTMSYVIKVEELEDGTSKAELVT